MVSKICYSIFGADNPFFHFYLRGLVWNVKMNRILYPDWQTHIEIESDVFSAYDNIFYALKEHYGISFNINPGEPLCKSMLWRLKPIFDEDVERILCRDADAITTHRETVAVQEWIESGAVLHNIQDNKAHGLLLMGGMCGITSEIRETFKDWQILVESVQFDYSKHGSDQHFLNRCIVPYFSHHLSNMAGRESDYSNPLWLSDLTCRHIGSAGVVEMETIRFFKNYPNPMEEVEKKYSDIFYWHK